MPESEAAEKVLALVIKLHLDKQPWPPRKRVAEITGVPLAMLDVVITELHDSGQIDIWTATTKGNLRPEKNGLVQKFIQPAAHNREAEDWVAPALPPAIE